MSDTPNKDMADIRNCVPSERHEDAKAIIAQLLRQEEHENENSNK